MSLAVIYNGCCALYRSFKLCGAGYNLFLYCEGYGAALCCRVVRGLCDICHYIICADAGYCIYLGCAVCV